MGTFIFRCSSLELDLLCARWSGFAGPRLDHLGVMLHRKCPREQPSCGGEAVGVPCLARETWLACNLLLSGTKLCFNMGCWNYLGKMYVSAGQAEESSDVQIKLISYWVVSSCILNEWSLTNNFLMGNKSMHCIQFWKLSGWKPSKISLRIFSAS